MITSPGVIIQQESLAAKFFVQECEDLRQLRGLSGAYSLGALRIRRVIFRISPQHILYLERVVEVR